MCVRVCIRVRVRACVCVRVRVRVFPNSMKALSFLASDPVVSPSVRERAGVLSFSHLSSPPSRLVWGVDHPQGSSDPPAVRCFIPRVAPYVPPPVKSQRTSFLCMSYVSLPSPHAFSSCLLLCDCKRGPSALCPRASFPKISSSQWSRMCLVPRRLKTLCSKVFPEASQDVIHSLGLRIFSVPGEVSHWVASSTFHCSVSAVP